jgi:hypothetical protein
VVFYLQCSGGLLARIANREVARIAEGWWRLVAVVLGPGLWWYRGLEESSYDDLPISSNTTSDALHRSISRDAADMLLVLR